MDWLKTFGMMVALVAWFGAIAGLVVAGAHVGGEQSVVAGTALIVGAVLLFCAGFATLIWALNRYV